MFRKTSALESLFDKVIDPQALIKKRIQHRCFPVHITKFLRTYYFEEHMPTAASVTWYDQAI